MRPKPDRDIYEVYEHCQPGQLLYKTVRLKLTKIETETETETKTETENEAEAEVENEAETESYAKSWLGFQMRPTS